MILSRKGQLTIFFSYAEGSGKTQTMLRAARKAKDQGLSVLVGTIASHQSEEIRSLMEGLEILPPVR